MTEREKVGGIIDRTMGMFLQDKRNPIYKNIKSEIVDQIASIVIESLGEKGIKVLLLARNQWFYDYLNGDISIGKFKELIAKEIVADIKAKWGENEVYNI